MRTVVLYAKADLEPITVFKIPFNMPEKALKERGWFRVAVSVPISTAVDRIADVTPSKANHSVVTIEVLVFNYKNQEKIFLVTDDEETALRLRPELLSGQQKLKHELYEKGFSDGFINALQQIRKETR